VPRLRDLPRDGGANGPWTYHLLPYIEQDNVYRAADAAAPIKTYQAPGDPTGKPTMPWTNYAANALVLPVQNGFGPSLAASFPDGTSNTVLLVERYAVSADGGTAGTHLWAATTSPTQVLITPTMTSGFQVKPATGAATDALPQGLSSGGLQVCLADASVRTVTSGTSAATWFAACTPAGGEVLANDW
jgi:hypothetical protein